LTLLNAIFACRLKLYALSFQLGKVFMSHFHAVVWLDHSEAHVMHIAPDDVEKSVIHPSKPHQRLHAKGGIVGSGKPAEDKQYYHAVAEALKGAQEILVVGPAQAKLQLIKHLHAHDKSVADKVIGVESIDHPSDGQLVAYARKYFAVKDKMLGTAGSAL
jgi:stalled ribosome rescue protein Dom34